MSPLLEKKFVIVAGKGGVGRTTVSLSIGAWAASLGKRTLVCLANSPSRYGRALGHRSVDSHISTLPSGCHVVNIDPVASREEYGLKVLKNKTLHRLVFGSKYVNAFLDAVPGLSEWAMLGKATYHALEETGVNDKYDLVVFDSPATGHGLDVLRLPAVIAASVQTGRMREEALLRLKLLRDDSRCAVIPVTLLEEMPVNETIELIRALEKRRLPVMCVVLNRVIQTKLKALEFDFIPEMDVSNWALAATAHLNRCKEQRDFVLQLERTFDLPLLSLPELNGGQLNADSIEILAARFSEGLSNHSR